MGKEELRSLQSQAIWSVYTEKSEEIQNLLEVIEFIKYAKYIINIQKQFYFYICPSNWKLKLKTVPLILTSNIMKYLRINLTEDIQDSYTEFYNCTVEKN